MISTLKTAALAAAGAFLAHLVANPTSLGPYSPLIVGVCTLAIDLLARYAKPTAVKAMSLMSRKEDR